MASGIRFSAEAADDLRSIAAFTFERFGEAQQAKYEKALAGAFNLIGSFPQIGRDVSDVKKDARRHVHASHAIYYLVRDKEILVLRILGPGQDPEAEFAE